LLTERFVPGRLDLSVRPPRDLDNEVDDLLVRFVGIERDVVPKRSGASVFF
jgi:hypothetical protein